MSLNLVSPSAELAREPMRWPKKLNLPLAIIAGLFTFWVRLEHERAESSVEAYKRELLAKGELLDLKELRPPMPKPEENAAPEFLAAAKNLKTSLNRNIYVAGKPLEFTYNSTEEMMRQTSPLRARVTWRQLELGTVRGSNDWLAWIAWTEENRTVLRAGVKALDRPSWGVNVNWDPRIENYEHQVGLGTLFRRW